MAIINVEIFYLKRVWRDFINIDIYYNSELLFFFYFAIVTLIEKLN